MGLAYQSTEQRRRGIVCKGRVYGKWLSVPMKYDGKGFSVNEERLNQAKHHI